MSRRLRVVVCLVVGAAIVAVVAVAVVLPSRAPTTKVLDVGPQVTEVPADAVEVTPRDDLRQLVRHYPAGTTFSLSPGVYRQGGIVPRAEQRFLGGPGVVLSGARPLDPDAFTRSDGGGWAIGGQRQEGLVAGDTLPGRERDQHPEELFVDGHERLVHVASLQDLAPGTWFFDYAADRIHLHDDPASFESIETSVHAFAFGGIGVRDVLITDVVVEKYASPHYYGALGGSEGSYPTHGWTYRGVTARYNHGAGIAVGPGTVVEWSRVHHNGQIGLVGDGEDPFDGYAAPVVVRRTEIDHNLQLGFDWAHEGGGTKFKRMTAGMVFRDNWVHDNGGPGVWWDVFNEAVLAEGNLVEGNAEAGMYYELGFGPAVIADNVVIGNGGSGIQVSTSVDVEVRGNLLVGNGDGLNALHNQDQIGAPFPDSLDDVRFVDNEVWTAGGDTGIDLFGGSRDRYDLVVFRGNRYHLDGEGIDFRFRGADLTPEEWLAEFPEDGPIEGAGQAPPQDAGADLRGRFARPPFSAG